MLRSTRLFGDGRLDTEPSGSVRCQACRTTFTARRNTPLIPSKTPFSSGRHGALGAGRRTGRFRRRTGLWVSSGDYHHLADARSPCMRRSCMNAASYSCSSHTCSWRNCAAGYAAVDRCSGSGWPLTPARRFFLCSTWAPARKTPRILSSTPCDRGWPQAVFRSLRVTA